MLELKRFKRIQRRLEQSDAEVETKSSELLDYLKVISHGLALTLTVNQELTQFVIIQHQMN